MANFDIAIEVVLANEGVLSDDSADRGGLTKYGISQHAYPNLDIASLTLDDAKAIYKRDYWEFDEVTSQDVGTKLLDMAVNLGKMGAVLQLQKALTLQPTGLFDNITLVATNIIDPQVLLTELRARLAHFYTELVQKNPANQKFLLGWLRRAAR